MMKFLLSLATVLFASIGFAAPHPAAVLTLEVEGNNRLFFIKEARLDRDKHRMVMSLTEDQSLEKDGNRIAIVDISNPLLPQQQAVLALDKPIGQFALSPDGLHATLVTVPTEWSMERNFELIRLDLSVPASPEIIFTETITASEIWLSPNNTFYAAIQPSHSNRYEWSWILTWLDGSRTETLQDTGLGAQTLSSPNSRYLAINDFNRLIVWDLSQSPPSRFTRQIGTYGLTLGASNENCVYAISDEGYVLGQDTLTQRNFSYRIEEKWPREPVLPQQTFYCTNDYESRPSQQPAPGRYVAGAPDELYVFLPPFGQFNIIDLSNPVQPVVRKSGWMPDANSRWLAQIDDYMVTANNQTLRIYAVDALATPEIDWEALESAHQQHYVEPVAAQSLQKATSSEEYWSYMRSSEEYRIAMIPIRKDARQRLEEHKIIQAIAAPLNGFPAAKAAEILGDYESLRGPWFSSDREDYLLAVRLLERIIELAPERSSVYLNLANLLRRGSRIRSNWQAVLSQRQIIAGYYRQYLALGGESTPEIERNLHYYSAQENTMDICEAIAYESNEHFTAFTNRENILFDVDINGKLFHIQIEVGGSAKIPGAEFTDVLTGLVVEEYSIKGYKSPFDEHEIGGLEGLSFVMYGDDIHFLQSSTLGHSVKSGSLFSDKRCLFTTETLETIGQNAADPQVCRELQQGAEVSLYQFDQPVSQALNEQIHNEVRGSAFEDKNYFYAQIDVANNGQPLNIVEIPIDSSAGSGCHGTYYMTLNGSSLNSESKSSLLNKIQDSSGIEEIGYPINCGNSARFFSYKGRVYFEDKNDFLNQYHKLKRVDKDRVVDICDYQLSHKTRVEKK